MRVQDTLLERPAALVDRAWNHPRYGALVKAFVAYVVLIEGVLQIALGRLDLGIAEVGFKDRVIPRGLFLTGAVLGTLYALVGIGLILIYRANRIINFAQAALGSVPAVAALILMSRKGLPYPVAIVIALV